MATLVLLVAGCRSEEVFRNEAVAQGVGGRPNILFVMTDDMPERLLPAMPTVRERVVKQGVSFENAYVTQSLCCPSRATVLRGQYPHNHLVTSNEAPDGGEQRFRSLGRDRSTIATWLRDAGYRTGFVGKYMNLASGRYVPPGWSGWWGRVGGARDQLINYNGKVRKMPDGNSTDVYRKLAMSFLDRSTDRRSDPPFMLFVWTNAPHLPGSYPKRYADLYKNAKLPRPPSFDEADVSDKPAWVRDLPRLSTADERRLREEHRTQLRSLRGVDDMVGAMLDLLARRGELGNTYVVFTTDNGVQMGEHRWRFRLGAKSTAYEEAAGVPLAIRGPGVAGGVSRTQLVANNDLAPTFARWAGVEPPAFVDGRSLAPLLGATPPAEWRTALLNERHVADPGPSPVPNYDAVITPSQTYVEYSTGEKELYDRRTDPYQLSSKPESGNEALYAGLGARLDGLRACAGDSCRIAEGP